MVKVVELSAQALIPILLVIAGVFWSLGFWAGGLSEAHRTRQRRAEARRRHANEHTQRVMAPVPMLGLPTRPWPSIRGGEVVDTRELDDVT